MEACINDDRASKVNAENDFEMKSWILTASFLCVNTSNYDQVS